MQTDSDTNSPSRGFSAARGIRTRDLLGHIVDERVSPSIIHMMRFGAKIEVTHKAILFSTAFRGACHDEVLAADLIRHELRKGDETISVDAPLTRAVRTGGICFIDEAIEAQDVPVALHPPTDNRRALMIAPLSDGEYVQTAPRDLVRAVCH